MTIHYNDSLLCLLSFVSIDYNSSITNKNKITKQIENKKVNDAKDSPNFHSPRKELFLPRKRVVIKTVTKTFYH